MMVELLYEMLTGVYPKIATQARWFRIHVFAVDEIKTENNLTAINHVIFTLNQSRYGGPVYPFQDGHQLSFENPDKPFVGFRPLK